MPEREEIIAKLNSYNWNYADKDKRALEEIKGRICKAAKNRKILKYSELVNGIIFNLPNVNGGQPYRIRTWDWRGFDRALIGEFLGYISMQSYIEADFMASSIVGSAEEYEPSVIFFDWMRDLGLLSNDDEDSKLAFWADQVKKTFRYYSENF